MDGEMQELSGDAGETTTTEMSESGADCGGDAIEEAKIW
jgi:hypothetical protein